MTVRPDLQPLDSYVMPRDLDVATFMRLPRTDDLEHVDIGIYGVPTELATYRGGTRQGPAAVREASRVIRRVNPSTGVRPFDLANVADLGDVPVNVLDVDGSLDAARIFTARLRDAGIAPVAVGGDHAVSLPVLRGAFDGRPLGILQFDSHADIQDVYYGSRESHASMMRRGTEEGIIDPSRVVQVGLRGTRFLGEEDVQWGVDAGFTAITYDDYDTLGRAEVIRRIHRTLGDGPVYITYDIDGLDPTEAPGTPVREPGGLSMRDSQVILRSLTGANVIGGDVCEVAPGHDPAGITALNAANLLFEIVCLIAEARK
jgi:guanidinopropionase